MVQRINVHRLVRAAVKTRIAHPVARQTCGRNGDFAADRLLVNRAFLPAGKVFRLPDADLSDLGDKGHGGFLVDYYSKRQPENGKGRLSPLSIAFRRPYGRYKDVVIGCLQRDCHTKTDIRHTAGIIGVMIVFKAGAVVNF